MDALEIGGFLGELRKQRGLKQKDVAEALQVSDKAISRWETGRGIPDVDSLQRLSDFYEVSINEILSGRRIEQNEVEKVADQNLKVAVKKQLRLKIKLAEAIVAVVILLILLAVLLVPVQIRTVSLVNVYHISGDNGMEMLEEAFRIIDKLEEEGIDYAVSMKTVQGERAIVVEVNIPGREYAIFPAPGFSDMNLAQTLEYLDDLDDEEVDKVLDYLYKIGFW